MWTGGTGNQTHDLLGGRSSSKATAAGIFTLKAGQRTALKATPLGLLFGVPLTNSSECGRCEIFPINLQKRLGNFRLKTNLPLTLLFKDKMKQQICVSVNRLFFMIYFFSQIINQLYG